MFVFVWFVLLMSEEEKREGQRNMVELLKKWRYLLFILSEWKLQGR